MILDPTIAQAPATAEGFGSLNSHFVSTSAIGASSNLLTVKIAQFLLERHILTEADFSSQTPTFDPTESVTLRSLASCIKTGNLAGILEKYAGKSLPVPKGQLVLHRRHLNKPLKGKDLLRAAGAEHAICFSVLLGIALGIPPAGVYRRSSPVTARGQNYLPVLCHDGQVRIFRLLKAGLHDQSWTLFGPEDENQKIPVGGVLLFSTRL